MNKRLICLGAALMSPLVAGAESVVFQPRVFGGFMDYTLDTEGNNFDATYFVLDSEGNVTDEITFNDLSLILGNLNPPDKRRIEFRNSSAPLLGLGGTVAYGQFFLDGYYQSTTTVTGANNGFSSNFGDVTEQLQDLDFQHYDYALSLGYSLTPNWSLFAGYKGGKTDWDQDYSSSLVLPGAELGFVSKVDGEFEQDGPFVGASYSFLVGSGALTFKAAYAYLDGDFKWRDRSAISLTGIGEDLRFDGEEVWKLDGNSDAFSFGVSWTQPITENFGYSLGFNYQRYDFDLDGGIGGSALSGDLSGTTPIRANVRNGSIEEEIASLTVTVTYRF